MIVRNGLSLTIPVLFPSGHPDGNITWSLLDGAEVQIANGSVAPASDAVSVNLLIDFSLNTLSIGALSTTRDLSWSYSVGGAIINGELRYTIEARPPFGASVDGVRAKLGVNKDDLPDDDISLISAYRIFRQLAGALNIAAVTDTGGDHDAAMRDAVEAQAALTAIPTMAVRVASSEESGTNKFKRQAIDWEALAENLAGLISTGILVADPTYDPLAGAGAIFLLAPPATDAFTGA